MAVTRKRSAGIAALASKEEVTEDEDKRLPVTVLSGFLGAGKTTLLKKILRDPVTVVDTKTGKRRPWRCALIVNDMGSINFDADEIKHSKLIQEEAEMVELHNGCICCTLRGDLLKSVKQLSEEGVYDYLVIESTGISEPLPVAQTFTMTEQQLRGENEDDDEDDDDDEGDDDDDDDEGVEDEDEMEDEHKEVDQDKPQFDALSNYARLDTMVTVVDAVNIFDVLGSIETLADKNNSTGMSGNAVEGQPEDDRSIVQLFLDQIEFANVIVISKVSVVVKEHGKAEGMERARAIRKLLQKLNPKAQVVMPTEDLYGDLDTGKTVVNTHLFKMEEEEQTEAWMKELQAKHVPETEEYGIQSIVFESGSSPFHPMRLNAVIKGFGKYAEANTANDAEPFRGVFRSKGQVWLANANAYPLDMHTAGRNLHLEPQGMPFLDATPMEDWEPECYKMKRDLEQAGRWSAKHGDRFSRLVLIGQNMNKPLIELKLREALLTERETVQLGGVSGWSKLEDPFFEGECADHFFEAKVNEDEGGMCALEE